MAHGLSCGMCCSYLAVAAPRRVELDKRDGAVLAHHLVKVVRVEHGLREASGQAQPATTGKNTHKMKQNNVSTASL